MSALSAVPGLLLVAFCICKPLHGFVGQWATPRIAARVTSQIKQVVYVQRAISKYLTVFVHMNAATVAVDFYLISLPLMLWIG